MIKANVLEKFSLTVLLVDELEGIVATNRTVNYEIRNINEQPLAPQVSGVLNESTIEPGIYIGETSINTIGNYIAYITCSGFLPNVEEINIFPNYDKHFNTSVEDVVRTSIIPDASQAARNVGLGKTDYILNRIKPEHEADWLGPSTISGSVYAHYRSMDDDVPYKMSGPF